MLYKTLKAPQDILMAIWDTRDTIKDYIYAKYLSVIRERKSKTALTGWRWEKSQDKVLRFHRIKHLSRYGLSD